MPTLFEPIRLGAFEARNRIFMAPLTRGRATREHVPTPLMIEYYAQRAGAGVIFTEATGISRQGLGWPYAPGIWSDEQVAAWRPVTDAVHDKGGHIVLQLWHMGRVVHPSFLDGQAPVSASATTAPDNAHTYDGKQPYAQARPLELSEIPALLDDYRRAARNALAAGFDGVQLHAANGYLIDQFLRDGTNHRTDAYGGPIARRVRLLKEVTQALVDTVGGDRTGVRLSPNTTTQGAHESHPVELFTAAAETLQAVGIAHLELREPPLDGDFGKADVPALVPQIRRVFKGVLIENSNQNADSAQALLDAGTADAVTFGRLFIANPDLPRRFAEKLPLNPDDTKTWYTQGPQGYVDYPFASSGGARHA
jgi:N-ethylmaleimide reductase